jgi:hypothetical protein
LSVVKAHRATVTAKEREILAREQTLLQNEQWLTALLNKKDQEIASLQQLVSQIQQQQQQFLRQDVEVAVKLAAAQREEELRNGKRSYATGRGAVHLSDENGGRGRRCYHET